MKRPPHDDDRELAALLAEVSSAARARTDAVFTEERLAIQRARVLQRIAHIGQPGRVLTFPNVATSATRLFGTRPSTRWVAAAAAAGLAIGLLVGRLSTPGPTGTPGLTAAARITPEGSVFLPAAIRLSDDEFLGQVESAATGPAALLRSLHELTPIAGQLED